jgi:hypothetical protein
VIRLTDFVRHRFTNYRCAISKTVVNHGFKAQIDSVKFIRAVCTLREPMLHRQAASFVYRSGPDWTDQLDVRAQGGTIMKSLKTIGIVAALALGLTTAAFAKPLELQTLDSAGANSTPSVSFTTKGFPSTNQNQDSTLDVYVPVWSLGVVGVDINGANLKISNLKAPAGITVSLKDASGGATKDRLRFAVCAAANTPKGTYLLEITLENSKFGDRGKIVIKAEVI